MESQDITEISTISNQEKYVKPFYWDCGDKVDDNDKPYFSLVMFGHEFNTGDTIALHIKYEPWIDIVLPEGIREYDAANLQAKIMNGLRKILEKAKHAPTRAELSRRLPLYYYTQEERYCLKMHFETEEALNHCKNLLKKPLTLYGCEPIAVIIAGANNGQIERLHAELDIRPCDWVRFKGAEITSYTKKVTTCRQEYDVNWYDIQKQDPDVQQKLGLTYPSFLVFDYEMYSDRKYAFPDELNSLDCIFMGGILFFKYNFNTQQYDVEEYALVYHKEIKQEQITPIPYTDLIQVGDEKYEIKLKNIDDTQKEYDTFAKQYYEKNRVRIIWYTNEIELIDGVEDIITFKDPDGIIGHNSDAFDFKYHKVRKGRMAEKYKNISRTKDWNQSFENIQWESSAYNEINLWVPDGSGRIYFDTLLMTKRDYKEDSYGLDFLCQRFMGIGKHDWSPEDIFASFRENIPDNLRTTIRYCMQDVWCTWGLFQHLSFWSSYSGMSNIMGVGIFDLFSRGQQIRNITQTFKECHRAGYFLHAPERVSRSITGGYVFPQIPGLYEYVLLLDFEGLYPSIMRRYNISNDTFDLYNNAKDEDCFIFNWSDDHGDWSTRFVKPHIRKGLVPSILEKLYNARNVAKAKMAECKKIGDKRGAMVYNVEQLANKLSGNSIYGGISQKNGKLSLSEAGAAVTAYGRMSIQKAGKWVNDKGYDVIYGDSVTSQTPILLRMHGIFTIITIAELFDCIINKDSVDKNDSSDDGKEHRITLDMHIEAWTATGWTKVHNVMRHKIEKKIYRVITRTGYVEVTEDHSLIKENFAVFTPKEAKIGDKLLASYPINNSLQAVGCELKGRFNNQLEAARQYHHFKKHYGINIYLDYEYANGKDNFVVVYDPSRDQQITNEIIKIEPMDYNGSQYVYDLTTENHHFQAGIGDIIVHNTDSIFVKKRGELTLEEKMNFWADGQKLADQMNADCFQAPIRMQVDGAFRVLHSISKKMYQMIKLNPKKPLEIDPDNWTSKGLVTAKRDSCKMIRNIYKETAKKISCLKDTLEIIDLVANEIQRLLTGTLNIEEMISIRKLGKGYTNKNLELPLYQKHLHGLGMNVKPGDRLPFVYALRPYKVTHQGEKWEDPDVFVRGNMEFDRIQYLKSQFANKLDTLLHTAFPAVIPPQFIAKIPKMLEMRPNTPIINIFAAIMQIYVEKLEQGIMDEHLANDGDAGDSDDE